MGYNAPDPWRGVRIVRGFAVPTRPNHVRLPLTPRLVVVTHPAGPLLAMDFDGTAKLIDPIPAPQGGG